MATKKKTTKSKPTASKKKSATSTELSDLADTLKKLMDDPMSGSYILLVRTRESDDRFGLHTVMHGLSKLEAIGLLELAKNETIDG